MNLRNIGVAAVAALAFGACTAKPDEAVTSVTTEAVAPTPASAGYTPVVSLNELMVYVVDPRSNELWDAMLTPPSTDEGWRALQRSAVTVAAAGSLTKESGNGPDDQRWTQQADWAKYSQGVSDAGLAALTAVRAKDRSALAKAGDQLVLSCINCHREYKLDIPKIWTERQFPPEEQKRP